MKKDDILKGFAEAIGSLKPKLNQTDTAVALLWVEDHFNSGVEVSAKKLGTLMHNIGISNPVNIPRLNYDLQKNGCVVRGSKLGFYKIKVNKHAHLDSKYLKLLSKRKVKIQHLVLPEDMLKGTRPYFEKLAFQINGCYESSFYDACAVLCRRIIESLLIHAFEKKGKSKEIKRDGEYVMLAEIISKARSGQYIKLGRKTGPALEKIKGVGDTAAHDRHYITKKHDIDDISIDFRRSISDLMVLAEIG